MTHDLKLAWATHGEASEMAAVHALAFPRPWDAEAFEDLLDEEGVFGFLARDGAVAGLVLCRVAADEMEVLTIGVDPAARRKGVARALMSAALGAAAQAGASTCFLEVAVDNHSAAALYASLGFRRAGLRKGYYDRGPEGRVDALVMRLDLNAAPA